MQGVASKLCCLLDSGSFCFYFKSSADCVCGSMQLIYFPHIYQNMEDLKEVSPVSGRIILNEDQIEDFVRKLGFLDVEGDAASQISHFLYLKQASEPCGRADMS